jgi:2-polyprenyl-3-methyl-5-hydroxy-6-metoxy-1,4-benzoquinol methylase
MEKVFFSSISIVMILKKIYNKIIHKNYQNFPKIKKFYTNFFNSRTEWINELSKRFDNNEFDMEFKYSFSPHSPITNPYKVLDWVIDRLHPFFEYFDKKNVNSILEIGCGYGVSTWFLKDKFKNTTGLDISENAISTAQKIWPEIDFVKSDVMEYFKNNPDKLFDVILSCDGPPVDMEKIMKHCKYFVRVGYRPKTISGAIFKMTEKLTGLQLAFSTTVVSEDFKKNIIKTGYLKYYFTPYFFRNLTDSITKKYFPF